MEKIFNSGLLLSRPHESAYSRVRRFLIANRSQTAKAMHAHVSSVKQFSAYFSRFGRIKTNGIRCIQLAELLHSIESDQAKQLGLPGPVYPNPAYDTFVMTRNCPTCAATAYHCYFYEYLWITTCPIHRIPLTELCPACGERWPSLAMLPQRNCSTCGKTIRLNDFKKNGGLDNHPAYLLFSELEEALSKTLSEATIRLQSNNTNTALDYWHSSICMTHKDYPSIYASQYPDMKHIFNQLGIKTEATKRFVVPIEKLVTIDRPFAKSHEVSEWEAKLKHTVFLKIAAFIRRSSRNQHTHDLHDQNVLKSNSNCLYCNSYEIWKALCNIERDQKYSFSSIICYIHYQHIGFHPFPPIPMKAFSIKKADIVVYWNQHIDYYVLPENLQKIFYYIDLWVTYKNIYAYVKHWLVTSKDENYVHKILKSLPDEGHPGKSICDSLGMFYDLKASLVTIIIKKSLINNIRDVIDINTTPIHTKNISNHSSHNRANRFNHKL